VARAANTRGVRVFPGSLARSRARLLHYPSNRPRATAASTLVRLSGDVSGSVGITMVQRAGGPAGDSSVL
jgi:hypothetical protein